MGTLKPYTKPNVEKVKLVVEEAVLEGCKDHTSTGPNDTYCQQSNITLDSTTSVTSGVTGGSSPAACRGQAS